MVDIHVISLTFQEQFQLIDRLCGAWADDLSIPEGFSEIDEQRHSSIPSIPINKHIHKGEKYD